MAKMQANQMRAGMVIEFEGARYTILKQNIMIPGKGAAVIQVDMRNIRTGAKKDQRWRTADTVERLMTEDKEFTYSYAGTTSDDFLILDTASGTGTISAGSLGGQSGVFVAETLGATEFVFLVDLTLAQAELALSSGNITFV